nr:ribosomal RNA small subunit methyltransferase NEP1 [Seculamonas ecuadoriensis]
MSEFERKEPSLASTPHEKDTKRRLVVVLENACLETAKIVGEYQLLNYDQHKNFLGKYRKDPKLYRPDITHQCLLTLLDSPLNKSGNLQVFIRTAQNVLIEVNPRTRIPRTFKRFCGLMVQLLHKLKIRATNGSETLLRVVKNPITIHLPTKGHKFGASMDGQLVKLSEFVGTLPRDEPVVFVVGAFAHDEITNIEYVEEYVSFSEYPLSAAGACAKLCCAFEDLWEIL